MDDSRIHNCEQAAFGELFDGKRPQHYVKKRFINSVNDNMKPHGNRS